jgi:hypothetical protein
MTNISLPVSEAFSFDKEAVTVTRSNADSFSWACNALLHIETHMPVMNKFLFLIKFFRVANIKNLKKATIQK